MVVIIVIIVVEAIIMAIKSYCYSSICIIFFFTKLPNWMFLWQIHPPTRVSDDPGGRRGSQWQAATCQVPYGLKKVASGKGQSGPIKK